MMMNSKPKRRRRARSGGYRHPLAGTPPSTGTPPILVSPVVQSDTEGSQLQVAPSIEPEQLKLQPVSQQESHQGRPYQGRPHHPRYSQRHSHSHAMISLAQRCERQFQGGARARGRDYFLSGRVSDSNREGQVFTFSVKGNEGNYHVRLDLSEASSAKSIQGRCDCPYYKGGGLCKHLWAAILQMDQAGLANEIPQGGPLRVLHVQPRLQNGHLRGQQNYRHHFRHSHKGQIRAGAYSAGISPNQPVISINGVPTTFPSVPNKLPSINGTSGSPVTIGVPGSATHWVTRLDQIQNPNALIVPHASASTFMSSWSAFFVINAAETISSGRLVLDLWIRDRLPNGELGPLKPSRVMNYDVSRFSDLRDQEVLSVLLKTSDSQTFAPFGRASGSLTSRFSVDPILETHLIPNLAQAGKFFLSRSPNGSPDDADRPLRMDRGKLWDLQLKIDAANHGAPTGYYRLDGFLRRDGEIRPLTDPLCVFRSGYLLFSDRINRLEDTRKVRWASALRSRDEFLIPREEGDELLRRLLTDSSAPKVTWPSDLGWSTEVIEPRPKGVFRPLGNDPATGRLTLTVSFDYAGKEISLDDTKEMLVDIERKRVDLRNSDFEEKTLRQALEILRDEQGTGTLPVGDLHRVATELSNQGWLVYIENQRLRVGGNFEMNISTSTDWFDLRMSASFGEAQASQPELMAALEAKNGLVKLPDGSVGMVPQEWLARLASLCQLGTQFGQKTEDGTLRFNSSQGLMLNAVLSEEPLLKADRGFLSFQKKIRKFEGVKPSKAPKGFRGKLRNYQKEGLAWLDFIEEFGTGGILADDMGLGKTIQLLAFLQGRKKSNLPSLVVAPKSLVFNWMDEALRFVPGLRVVSYSGAGRTKGFKEIAKADLVVTTYGTLRTDIEKLKEIQFDVAIIDEAQAIKNPVSQAALACKMLKAKHRLALTGTPIENSLGDLFSILEFTSPGLLGLSREKEMGDDTRSLLARMLRPFVLRRTKEKVLKELPEKTEQVLFCEMSAVERQVYATLRDHYRASLAGQIEKSGLSRSKIHVLEALLRLRQAACHPGLVNPELKSESSAKLSQLLDSIQEAIQEGHKALIFSQFTSLLDIVRVDLERAGITYEYLDGSTVDRKKPVERFQTDPKCPVFLISLKAGGTGLNLTAADYVFILDPWWNPAVEAQAIGRAHRLGQTQKVFTYRMIARGTVEEKILDLQKSKRELAESIISEDKDFLRKLSYEDLQQLLT